MSPTNWIIASRETARRGDRVELTDGRIAEIVGVGGHGRPIVTLEDGSEQAEVWPARDIARLRPWGT